MGSRENPIGRWIKKIQGAVAKADSTITARMPDFPRKKKPKPKPKKTGY